MAGVCIPAISQSMLEEVINETVIKIIEKMPVMTKAVKKATLLGVRFFKF